MKRRDEEGGAVVALVEDAVGALRAAPAATLAWYYAGTVPFVAAFAYAWIAAGPGLAGEVDVVPLSLLLAGLFVVMKTTQARFAACLIASLRGVPPAAWSWRGWLRVACRQILIQVPALFYLPAAFVTLLPFGWTYAYVQSATVLSGDPGVSTAEVRRRAAAQSRLWPIQNHFAIWLVSPWLLIGTVVLAMAIARLAVAMGGTGGLAGSSVMLVSAILVLLVLWPSSPLGFAVAGNMAVAVIAVPWVLKVVFDLDTLFTVSGFGAFANTSFMMVVCVLTYLVLDPPMKAVYVLRCFRGDSLATGADLRAAMPALRRLPGVAAAVLLLTSALGSYAGQAPANPVPPAATPPASSYARVDPVALDRAVRDVLADPAYGWRTAQKAGVPTIQIGWLSRFFDGVTSWFDRILKWTGRQIRRIVQWIADWLRKLRFEPPSVGGNTANDMTLGYAVLFAGLAVAICAAVILYLRRARRAKQEAVQAVAAPARPDLASDQVLANDLPEDEWLRMADEMVARGEWRLAMRALFLGGLATLNSKSLVRVARHKTNRDYLAELRRYGHAAPASLDAFMHVVGLFEKSWYGTHAADAETVADIRMNVEAIRRHAAA